MTFRRRTCVLALGVALVSCGGTAEISCPSGTRVDDAHALRIRARLATVPIGAELLRDAGSRVRAICFAPEASASVVDDARNVVLASDLEEGEAAARLGHLLVHLRDGLPDAELAGPDCDAAVARALTLEAPAYVREVMLQDELGAAPRALRFEFTRDVLAAPAAAREPLVLAYLRGHPDGAPGIDALANGYRARCERAR